MAETLIASAVMVMIVMAVATLASAVQQNADYTYATSTAHQHGRVVVERIAAAVNGAASSSTEPPVAVLTTTSSTYTFPDTLVVWRADSNGDDVPQLGELVVYCPNPSNPSVLWELSLPGSTTVVTLADAAALATRVDALKASATATKTTLTSLLRSITSADIGAPRGAVRFALEMRPTEAEWAQYKASTLAWSQLSWAQGIYGDSAGLRQARVAFEVQLIPEENRSSGDESQAAAFLGSAAVYYEQAK